MVYIHKGEHDDPHGLPQQDLEGSTETEHTLHSHTASSSPEIDSFKKLEYIYQHFQDREKIYESNQTLMQLGTRPIATETHTSTMILNMVYLKISSIAII